MSENKDTQKFGGKTLESWQGYINTSLKKTVEATFDSAKRIAAYKKVVEDEVFKSTLKNWYGFTASHLSYWAKISENAERFEKHIQILPASPRSLYELSAIDVHIFEELVTAGKIKPSLTVESIKELKAAGGKIKTFLLKYGDSPDYLELCREADKLKADDLTSDEIIKKLAAWVREHKIKLPAKAEVPAKAALALKAQDDELESEDFEEDEDDIYPSWSHLAPNGELALPKIGQLVPSMTREQAYAMFGIYLNKPLDNMGVERALIAQAGDDESLQLALEVILA